MRRTPPIMARGRYQLLAPFEAPQTKVFICYAIRNFKDLYELGEDVYQKYYQPVGLSQAVFQEDVSNNVAIITLISDDHQVIYVPDSYILSYPDMGEVTYHRVILSVDFGVLPDYLDFDHTKTQVGNVATDVIGKMPAVTLHVAPSSGVITPDEHETLESSRLFNVQNQTTDRAKYLQQLRLNDDLIQRIQTLEQIIIDNGLLD